MELDELLTKTIIGKFFSKLTISELDLGVQFPEIKNLEVSSAELHPIEGHIEKLDILMSLDYKGDFLLKIDADMVLGKKGNLSMRVKQLTGKARLQFTRKPFSHWSISFIQEPVVDLAIESKIQGRQMQSNVTSLIASAVKKAIRRKHVLPNYKLRFKPFFNRLVYDEVDMPVDLIGSLEVTLRTLTRACYSSHVTSVYATVTLSHLAWITAQQHDDQNVIITIDIEIHKAKNQQIGIIFKQTDRVCIETIIPKTPAAVANIRRGDVLISIEGRKLNHINQVAKLLKTLNQTVITLRIERIVPGVLRNDASLEDFADVYEDFDSGNSVSFSKNSDSIQIGNEVKVATTGKPIAKEGSNESSKTSTPSNSPRKVSSEAKPLETTESSTSLDQQNIFMLHSSNSSPISDYVRMEDSTIFNLNSSSLFLNVNVFGRSKNSDSSLLGYVSIPVDNVLAECSESNFNYIEKFMLNPPEMPELSNHSLSAQSGFSSSICYGDVCIGFCWNHEQVSPTDTSRPSTENALRVAAQSSVDKLDGEVSDDIKKHDFVRTHFNRSTVCDFCGKKIWLKDAVQCRECSMSCHKKCMVKSQTSTVCSGTIEIEENDESTQPEFKVTAAVDGDDDDCEVADEAIDNYSKLSGHRQSFSELLSQGIKRVNSANNLNIPSLVSSLAQNSKSLPPTPQHTPRKRSLIATNINPFIIVVQKLEQIPEDKADMTSEEIKNLVDPLDRWGTLDDLMELAKSSSDFLYADLDTDERIHKINALVSSSISSISQRF